MATKKTTKAKPKTSTAKVSTKARSSKSNGLLSRLQLVSALVFIILAILVGWLVKDTSYQLTASYLTKDELARQPDAFLPAIRNIYDLNLRWTLVVILAGSAVVPLLTLTKLKNSYTQAVKAKVQALRWVDAAVTWALFVEFVALLSGVHAVMTLKLLAVLAAITMLLGWLSERQNKSGDRLPFILSLFTSLAVLAALFMALVSTYVWGVTNLPWFTYTASGAVAVGLALWQLNHYNYLRGFRSWKNYEVVERNYLLINLATKSVVALALIAGLR